MSICPVPPTAPQDDDTRHNNVKAKVDMFVRTVQDWSRGYPGGWGGCGCEDGWLEGVSAAGLLVF